MGLNKNVQIQNSNLCNPVYKSLCFSEITEELPEDYPVILHRYDVWHWVKAVMKEIFKASKLKSCQGIESNYALPLVQNVFIQILVHGLQVFRTRSGGVFPLLLGTLLC